MSFAASTLQQSVSMVSEPAILATIWALFAASVVFFLTRVCVRKKHFNRLFADDYFALAGLLFLLANAVVTTLMLPPMFELLQVSVGLEASTPEFMTHASRYLKYQFTSTLLFWTCLWSVKFCFLFFYRRLTDRLKVYRRMWWAVTVFVTLGYIGSVITYPVACSSFRLRDCESNGFKDRSLFSLRFSTAVDVSSDFLIILLPVILLVRTKTSLQQKAGLFFVVILGVWVIVFSIVRIWFSNKRDEHPDISWLAVWSVIESSVAVIVAAVASYSVLLAKYTRPTSPATNRARHVAIESDPEKTQERADVAHITRPADAHITPGPGRVSQTQYALETQGEGDEEDTVSVFGWLVGDRREDLESHISHSEGTAATDVSQRRLLPKFGKYSKT
ncbi:Hypothetical protein R9X50_00202100 [Acrodontium crateriforme]|uniref:Rhodopsin domain-containing protein n=1 Tax=Acrodontium crateriforme TaxID=150365 RepID=A0AAQ3R371_9PEZI|nr:Hypothetical protein R9X50_00202100 [Acrodontium crateriforme]